MRRARDAALGCTLALLASAEIARAHPLAPSSVEVVEARSGEITMTFRTPSARPVGTQVAPVVPVGCRAIGAPRVTPGATTYRAVVRMRCAGGLVSKTFVLRGLRDAPTDVVYRVTLRDGTFTQGLLHGARDRFVVPRGPRTGEVITEYLVLGMEHLITGLDHVLFVLALLFALERLRTIGIAVTAFTLGHSVSLALAALGVLRLPQPPVEVAIAASLLYMAVVIAEREGASVEVPERARTHALVSLLFGLVHGLGFAGVLAEAGLPRAAVPEALFGFNVGIELAQLALVVVALGLGRVWTRVVRRAVPVRRVAAYAIGSLATMWIIERAWPIVGF